MMRWDIINSLIEKFGYESYLEIGTQNPNSNFNKIRASKKVSIEPFPIAEVSFVGTSDEYFDSVAGTKENFDIIFIDGLHHSDQVLRDIENSLKHLSQNGTIVCHDCLPTTEVMQLRQQNDGEWTGDVWKAIAQLRVERNDLSINVVDTDYGCGIIRRGQNELYIPESQDYLNFNYFQSHKTEMLNVISTSIFQNF